LNHNHNPFLYLFTVFLFQSMNHLPTTKQVIVILSMGHDPNRADANVLRVLMALAVVGTRGSVNLADAHSHGGGGSSSKEQQQVNKASTSNGMVG
jgi:hypothetical protein